MFEIDLNNGRFREIDLNLPVFCCKCGKEIIRGENCNTVNLVVDVCCGYAFCKYCKKKLMDFCGNKISKYEKKLVNEFLQDENEEDKLFELWVDENGGECGPLFNTFSDDELKCIFRSARNIDEKIRQ